MSDENNTFDNNDQQYNQQYNFTPDGNYQNGMNYNNSGKGQGTGLGIASMVCGICAVLFLCCMFGGSLALGTYLSPVLSIVAIVLGIVQLVKNESKGMAIAGIICGAVALVCFIGIICLGVYMLSSGLYEELYDEILNNYSSYY